MIAEIGFENIRMRMVAERAGVSTAALHYHFDTREKLFAAALRYSFGSTGADVSRPGRGRHRRRPAGPDHQRVAPDVGEPAPRVGPLAGAGCRAGRDTESRTLAVDLYQAHTSWIEETLDAGIASGEFEPCDTAAHAQLINSLCDGFGVQLMIGSPAVTLDSARAAIWSRRQRARPHHGVPGGWPTMRPAGIAQSRALQGCGGRRRCSARPRAPTSTRPDRGCRDQAGRPEGRRRPRLLQLGRLREPGCLKGFQKEYGVKIIQSNFDSMEGMVAKLDAGNRYDIIFPSAKWAQQLVAANQCAPIDPSTLKNAPPIFDNYRHFADPWYDQKSAHTVPFTMYKTGIGWRKDKLGDLTGSWNDLWNETPRGTPSCSTTATRCSAWRRC